MKILILCTGNSCRSQMAHGFLQSFDKKLQVSSAGTQPAKEVNRLAILAMQEVGIDIGNHIPQNVEKYLSEKWDYVITVCDDAKETCPVFTGKVKNRLHIGFEDPSNAKGSDEFVFEEFRRIRNEIRARFFSLFLNKL